MADDINTMIQDIKTGFRRIELQSAKFESNKRKNMDRYFQQVLNHKKQRYFEDLQLMQHETGGRSTTVDQLTNRVQSLKRYMHKNNGGGQIVNMRNVVGNERQRGTIKFTKAGYPIHDYVKEMREEREQREYKRSLVKARVDPSDVEKHAHLNGKAAASGAPSGGQKDILKLLSDEMEQERKELEERLAHGGIEALQEDERMRYELQLQLQEDQVRMKALVNKLIYEELFGVDSRQFEQYKQDEALMDEWTKQLIEITFADKQDSPILPELKELLKLADKELYRQVVDKKITLQQFKTRCMEKLNGNQFSFIDYDDVEHMIHPQCRNLDLFKVDKWAVAATGKHMSELTWVGPNCNVEELKDWQVQPHCLKSIAGFSLPLEKPTATAQSRRADSADVYSGAGRKRASYRKGKVAPSIWSFKKDERKQAPDFQKDKQLASSLEVSDRGPIQSQLSNTKGDDGTTADGKAKKGGGSSARRSGRTAVSSSTAPVNSTEDFYRQFKQFKINNGYLLRMIEDGYNVRLSDDFRQKLFMTADEGASVLLDAGAEGGGLAQRQADPTFGMTSAQKARYEKRLAAKPRPRDLFNVEEIVKKREQRLMERHQRMQERKQAERQAQKAQKQGNLGGQEAELRAKQGYQSIPSKVFGGPSAPQDQSSLLQVLEKKLGNKLSTQLRKGEVSHMLNQHSSAHPSQAPNDDKDTQKQAAVAGKLDQATSPIKTISGGFETRNNQTPLSTGTQGLLYPRQSSDNVVLPSGVQSSTVQEYGIAKSSNSPQATVGFDRDGSSQVLLGATSEVSMEKINLLGPKKTAQGSSKDMVSKGDQKDVAKMEDLSSEYRERDLSAPASQFSQHQQLKSQALIGDSQPVDDSKPRQPRTVISLHPKPLQNNNQGKGETEHSMPDYTSDNRGVSSLQRETPENMTMDRQRQRAESSNNQASALIRREDQTPLRYEGQLSSDGGSLVKLGGLQANASDLQIGGVRDFSNVNIHLMTPGNRREEGGNDQERLLTEEEQMTHKHPSLYGSGRSIKETFSQRSVTTGVAANRVLRSNTRRLGSNKSNAPPDVIPLYQLNKYQVKPSVELKKKRLRERQALQEACQSHPQQHLSPISKARSNPHGSAMNITKTRVNTANNFRGCMLRAVAHGQRNFTSPGTHASQSNAKTTGRTPYESGHFGTGRNLVQQAAPLKQANQHQRSAENLLSTTSPKVSHQFWQFLNNMKIPVTQSVSHRQQIIGQQAYASGNKHSAELTLNQTERTKGFNDKRGIESSLDGGLNALAERRTGYQTSDQNLDLNSRSALAQDMGFASNDIASESAIIVSSQNCVEDGVTTSGGQVMSQMASPDQQYNNVAQATIASNEVINQGQEDNWQVERLLNYTRKQNCAQTMLEYERQKYVKSSIQRDPTGRIQGSAVGTNVRQSHNVVLTHYGNSQRSNHQVTEGDLDQQQMQVIKVQGNEIGRFSTRNYPNNTELSPVMRLVNTDLITSIDADQKLTSPGQGFSDSAQPYEQIVSPKVEKSHKESQSQDEQSNSAACLNVQKQPDSIQDALSRKGLKLKHVPFGPDAGAMAFTSTKFTRDHLQKQAELKKEENESDIVARQALEKTKLERESKLTNDVKIEGKGYSLVTSSPLTVQSIGTKPGDLQMRALIPEENSQSNLTDSIELPNSRQSAQYLNRQADRMKQLLRNSQEMKKAKRKIVH